MEVKQKVDNPLEYSPFSKIKLECQPNYRSKSLNPYTYAPIESWEPKPQFWYNIKSAAPGPTWPVGNPSDYMFKSLSPPPKELEGWNILLQIERPERYLPGEIYKNKTPKDPIEVVQGSGCTYVWEPKRKELFNSKFDSSTIPIVHPTQLEIYKEREKETGKNLFGDMSDCFPKESDDLFKETNKKPNKSVTFKTQNEVHEDQNTNNFGTNNTTIPESQYQTIKSIDDTRRCCQSGNK